MESYLQGKVRAFGHKCEECVYYDVLHCNNNNVPGAPGLPHEDIISPMMQKRDMVDLLKTAGGRRQDPGIGARES